jgi:hypothetical protein
MATFLVGGLLGIIALCIVIEAILEMIPCPHTKATSRETRNWMKEQAAADADLNRLARDFRRIAWRARTFL